jgi:hypothetical protein
LDKLKPSMILNDQFVDANEDDPKNETTEFGAAIERD